MIHDTLNIEGLTSRELKLNNIKIRYIITKESLRCKEMAKEIDLKRIVTNLSKIGVTATVTKSRLELLKVLTSPTQTPQTQN